MHCRSSLHLLTLLVCGSPAVAAAEPPDAAAVVNAMYAAVGVGNVDAAASFFADDGSNVGPGGKTTKGIDDLRVLIRDLWIPENVQIPPGRIISVQGEKTILNYDISTKWIDRLGVPLAHQVQVVTLSGRKIQSISAWYTLESLTELMTACEARPDATMPNGAPCEKGISFLRRYTESLVTQGVAERK